MRNGMKMWMLSLAMGLGLSACAPDSQTDAGEDASDTADALTVNGNPLLMAAYAGRYENASISTLGTLRFLELQPGGQFNAVFLGASNLSIHGSYKVGFGEGHTVLQIKEIPSPGAAYQLKYPTKNYVVAGSGDGSNIAIEKIARFDGKKYVTSLKQDLNACTSCSVLDYPSDSNNVGGADRKYTVTVQHVSVSDKDPSGNDWDGIQQWGTGVLPDPRVFIAGTGGHVCQNNTECTAEDFSVDVGGVTSWTVTGTQLDNGLSIGVYDYDASWGYETIDTANPVVDEPSRNGTDFTFHGRAGRLLEMVIRVTAQ